MSGCLPLCSNPLPPLQHQSCHFQPERRRASGGHLQTALLVQSDTPQCVDCWELGPLGANAIPVPPSRGCNQPETLCCPAPADISPAACSESLSQTPLWRGHKKSSSKLVLIWSLIHYYKPLSHGQSLLLYCMWEVGIKLHFLTQI